MNSRVPSSGKTPAVKKDGPTEKTNKKVSRACNTCRLKRKKCDGLEPCYFCTETKVECSYSREPRRRGPPSGYLRYTETRVNLLETLLGLLCLNPDVLSNLFSLTLTLKSESKTCTQDVWDRYKATWLASEAAEAIEELTLGFAPFVHNREVGAGEGYAKPLLPLPSEASASKERRDVQAERSPTPENDTHLHTAFFPESPGLPSPSPRSVSFVGNPFSPSTISRESFERTQSVRGHSLERLGDRSSPVGSLSHEPGKGGPTSPGFAAPYIEQAASSSKLVYPSRSYLDPHVDTHDFPTGSMNSSSRSERNLYTGSYWRTAELTAMEGAPMFSTTEISPDSASLSWNPLSSTLSFPPSTSSDSISSNNPSATNMLTRLLAPPIEPIDLPPPHILANLVDVYYTHIHPTFPILSDRSSIENILRDAGNQAAAQAGTALGDLGLGASKDLSDATNCMLLSMCAYAGRLSSNIPVASLDSSSIPHFQSMYSNSTVLRGDEASAAAIFLSTDTSKVAADLWYEQARGAVNLLLRKPARLETVQALILLALRDYGKGGVAGGGESQAWLLIGMAIRLGQELDLPASASFSPNFTSLNMSNTVQVASNSKLKAKHSLEEHITRGNLWGILTMLDGLLSLQLGRAPAVAEALKPKPNANLHIYPSTVDAPTPGTSSSPSVSGLPTSILSSPPPLFAYSCLLSQIISKINFWLYLGFGPTPSPPSAPGPTNSRVSSALLSLSSSSSGSVTPLSTAEPQNAFPTQAKLATLRTELDGWLQMLPIQFRVSIGGIGFGATGLGTKEVLEVNMLYHVAVILLYRPFVKDQPVQQATDIFLDAASTFNLLLEKYKNQHMSSSTEANAFAMSNPSLIYLIFTVALAHLSGYKSRLQQARTNYHSNHRRSSLHYRAASPYPTTSIPIISFSSPPATPRQRTAPSLPTTHTLLTPQQQTQQLQTQLHLMNCLDALKSIGTTWELARRCWRTLDQLIDKEGMKPGGTGMRDREPSLVEVGGSVQSHGLGKRKREGDEVDNRLRTPAVPEKIQVRTSSVNSPESAHAMDCASDSESSFLGGPYTPRAFDVLQGTPLRVREDSDNLHMADWTKSQTTHQTQHTVYPGSGFDMPFFSNGWLSDFETEFLDVGVAGGALDVGTMETGGWGLPVDSWNGWVGDSAWEDKFFWGKGVESGLDTG